MSDRIGGNIGFGEAATAGKIVARRFSSGRPGISLSVS